MPIVLKMFQEFLVYKTNGQTLRLSGEKHLTSAINWFSRNYKKNVTHFDMSFDLFFFESSWQNAFSLYAVNYKQLFD